jgi:nucleoside-diphosphate-sugar epimerase
MIKPAALITGIAGQDGSYLADFLLTQGYRVVGMVCRATEFIPVRGYNKAERAARYCIDDERRLSAVANKCNKYPTSRFTTSRFPSRFTLA